MRSAELRRQTVRFLYRTFSFLINSRCFVGSYNFRMNYSNRTLLEAQIYPRWSTKNELFV